MKKIIYLIKFYLLLVIITIFTRVSFAAVDETPGAPEIQTVTLDNPLKNVSSIEGLLVAILNIVEILMIPVIVFFIILAGFKYVTARGNSTKVEEATRALTYAIIGGVLILAAGAISDIIQSTVESF